MKKEEQDGGRATTEPVLIFIQSKKKFTKNKKEAIPPLTSIQEDADELDLLKEDGQITDVDKILQYFDMDQRYVN